MAHRGIPPSPDQIVMRRQKRLAAGAGIVIFAAFLVAGIGIVPLLENDRTTAPAPYTDPTDPSPDALAEAERLSAYRAVQAFAEERLERAPVVAVYWRDNRHWIEAQFFHFEGIIDVQYESGLADRFPYQISVRSIGYKRWELARMLVDNKDYMAIDLEGTSEDVPSSNF